MKKVIIHTITIAILLFASAHSLYSQTQIRGIVKLGPEGIPIEGVSVSRVGGSTTTTNGTGEYVLYYQPGLELTLVASFGDYSDAKRTFIIAPGINNIDFWINAVTDDEVIPNSYSAVVIGNQVWMAENLKTTVYNDGSPLNYYDNNSLWQSATDGAYAWPDNNIENKDVYGALYNWYALNAYPNKSVCPTGWHVPMPHNWTALIDYLDGSSIAGGKIKESGTTHWLNNSIGTTNESGFSALPSGERAPSGDYINLGAESNWWTSPSLDADNAVSFYITNSSENIGVRTTDKNKGVSVRCIKDSPVPTLTTAKITLLTSNSVQSGGYGIDYNDVEIVQKGVCWSTSPNPTIYNNHTIDGEDSERFISSLTGLTPNTTYYLRAYAIDWSKIGYGDQIIFKTLSADIVTDINENNYNVVEIGNQAWFAENLKATSFVDGTPIPEVSDPTTWDGLITPALCWDNEIYGAYYNWFAISDPRGICPSDFRIATDADWTTLSAYLGGENVAGGKLKETGLLHWESPNANATNETGFYALPGGNRNEGEFGGEGYAGYWWSSSENGSYGIYRTILYNYGILNSGQADKQNGMSVRCVKDIPFTPTVVTTNITNITQNSAVSGGNVISAGGAPVASRGICWSTESNPTIETAERTSNGSGTGIFASNMIDLKPGTKYFLRAYATNNAGTGYGDEISFTTYGPDAITDVEGNFYNVVTIGSQTWLGENLKTKRAINGNLIGTTDPPDGDFEGTRICQWAYNGDESSVPIYGRLYTWYTVNGLDNICPRGWHVPSRHLLPLAGAVRRPRDRDR